MAILRKHIRASPSMHTLSSPVPSLGSGSTAKEGDSTLKSMRLDWSTLGARVMVIFGLGGPVLEVEDRLWL